MYGKTSEMFPQMGKNSLYLPECECMKNGELEY